MPDHWHALIQIGGQDTLERVIARIKATATRNINRITNRTESIWNKTYHDRAIRREEDLLPAARYIVANPLRAGLVRRVGDYPYWNAIWL
jgi:REP element-mobilizing transposase RayT